MEIKAIKIKLLNHLFYHTEISNGSITGGFLGDLALTYALNKALNNNANIYEHRLLPKYSEIKEFGYYFSVAKPVVLSSGKYNYKSKPSRTGSYTRNTLFNTDGFYDIKSIEKSAKSPFKNLIHTQGIALSSKYIKNEFVTLLIAKDKIELPHTLRIGNQKETLLELQELDFNKTDNDFWLNAYTLKVVFDNLKKASEISIDENGTMNYQYILENYALMKGFSKNQVIEIFKHNY